MENKPNTSTFFQRNKLFIFSAIALFLIIFFNFRLNYMQTEDFALSEGGINKDAIVKEYKSKAELVGLRKVKVIPTWSSEDKHYHIVIESSNMDNMSYSKMVEVREGLPRINNAYFDYFMSNGNKYEIDSSNRKILKNGQVVYDDYENSPSKRSHDYIANREKTYDFTSSEFTTAWDYAKKLAKASLKSPSSAKFQKSSELTMTCKGKSCSISAYVDADNSFGASIRTYFVVSFDMEVSVSGLATFTNAQCVFLE